MYAALDVHQNWLHKWYGKTTFAWIASDLSETWIGADVVCGRTEVWLMREPCAMCIDAMDDVCYLANYNFTALKFEEPSGYIN